MITSITFLEEGKAPRARRQTQTYLLVEQVKKEMLTWPATKPEMIIPFGYAAPSGGFASEKDKQEAIKKAHSEAGALLRALKTNLDAKVYICWKTVDEGSPCIVVVKVPAGRPAPAPPPKRK